MTEDMRSISCMLSGGWLLLLACPLLATCMPELAVLAGKYSLVQGILQHTTETIRQIKEAWELTSYAENNAHGGGRLPRAAHVRGAEPAA